MDIELSITLRLNETSKSQYLTKIANISFLPRLDMIITVEGIEFEIEFVNVDLDDEETLIGLKDYRFWEEDEFLEEVERFKNAGWE